MRKLPFVIRRVGPAAWHVQYVHDLHYNATFIPVCDTLQAKADKKGVKGRWYIPPKLSQESIHEGTDTRGLMPGTVGDVTGRVVSHILELILPIATALSFLTLWAFG